MDTPTAALLNKPPQNSSKVIYGNFSSVPKPLLEELYTFLENVHKQGDTISFPVLSAIFETHLDDDWNELKLMDGCTYLHRLNVFSDEFWKALLD